MSASQAISGVVCKHYPFTLIQGAGQQGRHALLSRGNVSLSLRLQLAGRLEVEQCIQVMLPAFLPNAQEERRIHSAIRWERTGVAQPAEIQGTMARSVGSPSRASEQRLQQSYKHLNWLNTLDKISSACNLYRALSRVGSQRCKRRWSPNKGDLQDIVLQRVPWTASPCAAAQPTSSSAPNYGPSSNCLLRVTAARHYMDLGIF